MQRRGEGTPEDTNPTGEQLRARGKGAAPREAARELSKDLGRGSRHWAAGTGGRATSLRPQGAAEAKATALRSDKSDGGDAGQHSLPGGTGGSDTWPDNCGHCLASRRDAGHGQALRASHHSSCPPVPGDTAWDAEATPSVGAQVSTGISGEPPGAECQGPRVAGRGTRPAVQELTSRTALSGSSKTQQPVNQGVPLSPFQKQADWLSGVRCWGWSGGGTGGGVLEAALILGADCTGMCTVH